MNGTTLERPDVTAYLVAVRAELSDLPSEERDDLIADVEASLLDSGEAPALSPAAFAAELREAAGIERSASAAEQAPSLLESARAWLGSSRGLAVRAAVRELAPIWWVVRGAVVAGVVVFVAGWAWTLTVQGAALATLVAVAASVWLGLRGRRLPARRRPFALAANLALAVVLLPVAAASTGVLDSRTGTYTAAFPEPVPGLAVDGNPVENIYAYDRNGRVLYDVRLYDENGLPLDVRTGDEDPLRRVLVDDEGTRLFNSFPIRYFEAGTIAVAQPGLGPEVDVAKVATPPLETAPKR